MVKRIIALILTVIMFFSLSLTIFATQTRPDQEELMKVVNDLDEEDELFLSPNSSDNLNIILMCLCISGGGLVILVVLTVLSKYKKK